MAHKAPAAAEKIGTGVAPDGRKVVYYEADRPGTLGHNSNLGTLVLAIDADGEEKITHSDSLQGLVKCGFKVDVASAPVADVAAPAPSYVEPKSLARDVPRGKRFGE